MGIIRTSARVSDLSIETARDVLQMLLDRLELSVLEERAEGRSYYSLVTKAEADAADAEWRQQWEREPVSFGPPSRRRKAKQKVEEVISRG
jgi:hypothetical protein